jgi:hypothetical protein
MSEVMNIFTSTDVLTTEVTAREYVLRYPEDPTFGVNIVAVDSQRIPTFNHHIRNTVDSIFTNEAFIQSDIRRIRHELLHEGYETITGDFVDLEQLLIKFSTIHNDSVSYHAQQALVELQASVVAQRGKGLSIYWPLRGRDTLSQRYINGSGQFFEQTGWQLLVRDVLY